MKASSMFGPISRLALSGCAVLALALSLGVRQSSAQATSRASVDPAMARRGKVMFTQKGCVFCHTAGRKGSHTAEGPDLGGVTERRTHEWLMAWLKDPYAMYGSDPIADAMVEQYHNVKMPNMKLSESDSQALLAYLATVPAP